ncbi:uncharacterized protein CCR75_008847 [Bremia lactucae]|uniref:Uncharacterized protein n=1 Tax=Bremia lactucae TaxID=4779 RepID=A0A976NZF7_BRELC|nr:hypothetical protein CCR75_008847 [Bremia lactucae]
MLQDQFFRDECFPVRNSHRISTMINLLSIVKGVRRKRRQPMIINKMHELYVRFQMRNYASAYTDSMSKRPLMEFDSSRVTTKIQMTLLM